MRRKKLNYCALLLALSAISCGKKDKEKDDEVVTISLDKAMTCEHTSAELKIMRCENQEVICYRYGNESMQCKWKVKENGEQQSGIENDKYRRKPIPGLDY